MMVLWLLMVKLLKLSINFKWGIGWWLNWKCWLKLIWSWKIFFLILFMKMMMFLLLISFRGWWCIWFLVILIICWLMFWCIMFFCCWLMVSCGLVLFIGLIRIFLGFWWLLRLIGFIVVWLFSLRKRVICVSMLFWFMGWLRKMRGWLMFCWFVCLRIVRSRWWWLVGVMLLFIFGFLSVISIIFWWFVGLKLGGFIKFGCIWNILIIYWLVIFCMGFVRFCWVMVSICMFVYWVLSIWLWVRKWFLWFFCWIILNKC